MMPRSFVTAMLLAAASPALAQVRQDTVPLEPIVITATRTPEKVATLGNHVTVLAGDDLRRAGITTVADALRVVAGAAVAQQSSWGSVTSLFLRGGQSSYVRILVDGVPLNQPGGTFDLSGVTTVNVERLELVRGPSSVVYGSDAMTGVLQIFTREGRGGARLRAEVRGGSYGTSDMAAELSAGGTSVGGTLAGARSATDGIYPFNSGFENTTASGSLWVRPDQRTDLRAVGRYHDAAFHFPTVSSGVAEDSNSYQTNRGTTLSLEGGRRFSDLVEARALLGYREAQAVFDDQPDNPLDTLSFPFHSDALVDRRSADLRLNLHSARGTVYTVGGVVELERERGSNSFGTDPTRERTNRAGYAQVVTGWERLSLQGGLRVDDNQAFGTFVTFRAGGVARLTPRTRLRLTTGTAFKEPSFFENYAAGFAVGNDTLKPERSFSWEVGLEQQIAAGRGTLTAGFFSQQFRDMIQFTGAPPQPGGPNFYNIAGANAAGLELGATWRPGAALRLGAEYTWLHTSVSDSGFNGREFMPGQPLIRRPEHSGAVTMDVTPVGRVSGGARLLLVGRRDDLDFNQFPAARVYLAGYARLDLWAEVAVLLGATDLSLTARVDNATDRAYQEVYGYPAPGVRVLVGARIDAGRWRA